MGVIECLLLGVNGWMDGWMDKALCFVLNIIIIVVLFH